MTHASRRLLENGSERPEPVTRSARVREIGRVPQSGDHAAHQVFKQAPIESVWFNAIYRRLASRR